MALTNTEKARAFKARMYAMGYKQKVVWVARNAGKRPGSLTRAGFIRKLDELTADLTKKQLSCLYDVLIRAIGKQRKKEGVE